MDSERREDYYTTRFGDVVDANTHATVAWHPALVDPGVYGSKTPVWIAGQMRATV
jgi:hypothetical protein